MSRKKYDFVMKGFTYLATTFTALILFAVIAFTFSNGAGLLSFKLITGDYHPETYSVEIVDLIDSDLCHCDYEGTLPEDTYYSSVWGVAVTDTENVEGEDEVEITYVHEDSPFLDGQNKNGSGWRAVDEGTYIDGSISSSPTEYEFTKNGAEKIAEFLEKSTQITDLPVTKQGGGIWGSVVTTVILIILTLLIAVPFGVLTSIYMNEYANKNKIMKTLETMIDTLTGVPSVIFGLLGAGVFIPLVSRMNGGNSSLGSILAGVMTLSVILLPVIVKTTKQALNQVPMDLRRASFALGANKTQTTFKVVLGNSIPGIVSGIILGIGRIVGESAALVLAMGTIISDSPELFDRSTSLAVHIYVIMGGSNPNFELASAIALIILMVVLLLNISVKLLTKRFNKMGRA